MSVGKAIIIPIALGVAAYIVSGVGLSFIFSFLIIPLDENLMWLYPATTTLIPLFLSGYVAGRYTVSAHRILKITFGTVSGVIGFALTLYLTLELVQPSGAWFLVVFFFGATIVAATGAFISTRPKASF